MPRRRVLFLAGLLPIALPAVAAAQSAPPSWTDTPALIAAATAPVDAALRACVGAGLPRRVTLIATRGRDGATVVAMPMPPVGGRGFTPEERCLMKAIARVSLPPLPPEIDRVLLGHELPAVGGAAPAVEAAFADWRDPGATLAGFLDARRRAALAGCSARARTVRLVLDLRKGATRVWLPAWQFHAPRGDGTTPPAERRVKVCLAQVVRGWTLPVLPRAMAELHLAIPVAPGGYSPP